MSKLYFRYAAMNAGKSTQVLQIANNYDSIGRRVLLCTAKVDDRYEVGQVTSRLGVKRDARTFDRDTDMLRLVREFAALGPHQGSILVDEAQFLTSEQVKALHVASHVHNVPVLCFGLRTDFQGHPFEGSSMLLALAEDIEEIKNVCYCGSKATMNVRMNDAGERVFNGPRVMIGAGQYVQVCGDCFYNVVKIPKRSII